MRLTTGDLKGKTLFTTDLPTSHSSSLKSIKSDTSVIRRNQNEMKEKIDNLGIVLSNTSIDNLEEIRSSLEEVSLILSDEFRRSHKELINRMKTIERGGNLNREEIQSIFNELKRVI